jgi:hypothetical protein
MVDLETSKLGVIFSYDSTQNILSLKLYQPQVLPRTEAERLLQLVLAYAASNPDRPEILIEAGDRKIKYEFSSEQLLQEYDPGERRCLTLMSQPFAQALPRLQPVAVHG